MLKENLSCNARENRFTAAFGHLFFFTLFLFSVIYFRERFMYSDPAFFSFLMIDGNNFSIAIGRWGTLFSQILPLIGLRSGANLETFLQLYSASFILLYYVYFLIIQYILKDNRASWILMLTLCLTFRITFYYPTAELYQGMALTVLLWSIIRKCFSEEKTTKWIQVFLIAILVVAISFYHQLTLFTILFVTLFEIINRNNKKDIKLWSLVLFTLIWYVIRIKLLTTSSYEKDKMLSSGEFMQQLFNITHLPSSHYFLSFIKHQILIPVICFGIGLFTLFRKNKLLSLFVAGFTVAFAILICVTMYKGESRMMYENYYSVFGLFIAFCIAHAFTIPSRNFATIATCLLLVFSIKQIQAARLPLTARVDDLRSMIHYGRALDKRKFIVSEKQLSKYSEILPAWSLPFETTLLSSLDGPAYSVTFFSEKKPLTFSSDQLNKKNVFLGPEWEPFWFSTNSFNKNYFNFPETGYLSLSSSQGSDSFKEAIFTKDNIKIVPLKNETRIDNAESFAEVVLTNSDSITLPSVPEGKSPVFISYHLTDENGRVIKWDNSRTVLLLDLLPGKSLVQKINIDRPDHPGKYKIQIDLVSEGIRWWGINAEQTLIVK